MRLFLIAIALSLCSGYFAAEATDVYNEEESFFQQLLTDEEQQTKLMKKIETLVEGVMSECPGAMDTNCALAYFKKACPKIEGLENINWLDLNTSMLHLAKITKEISNGACGDL